MTAILGQHVGHRTEPLDTRRLRCHDCQRTLLLPTGAGSTSSTSNTSPIPGPGDPRCPSHPTEHETGCRTCAADAKADETRQLVHRPTADVATHVAEIRAALPPPAPVLERTAPVDPERMAQARAELAAREPIPLPEQEPAS